MTATFTQVSYSVPSASSANLIAWQNQLVASFIACGGSDHVLFDSVTLNASQVYSVIECTINNLGNAFSKFYYKINIDATNVGFSHSIQTFRTWNATTHTGTGNSSVRNCAGAFPGNNSGAGFTVVLQSFTSAESRVLVLLQSGAYQVTLGYHIPASRPPGYDRSLYNYYVLIDPNGGGGTITYPNAMIMPPANPWVANMVATPITPATMTLKDSSTLQIPVLRGIHLYNAANGAAIGGLSSDFCIMPVSPIVGAGDRIVDAVTGEFFRPINFSTGYLTFGLKTDA